MEWLLTLATAAALCILFAAAEMALRSGASAESTRRLAHVVGAATAALFPLYLQLRDVLVLAASFTVFLVYTWVRGSLRSVHGVARPSIGALLFPIGLGGAALAVWGHRAALAFAALVLAFADPAAAVIGRRVPSVRWRVAGGVKSLSGSLACFVVAGTLAAIFCLGTGSASLAAAIIVAAMLAMIEGSLGYGLDNLPLPLAAALLGEGLLGL